MESLTRIVSYGNFIIVLWGLDMENNKGAVNWTVGKLLNIVLLVVVLALVVYGMTTGGLNPLIKNVEMRFDEVLAMFGFSTGNGSDGECSVRDVSEMGGGPNFLSRLGVSDASVVVCVGGVCNISGSGLEGYRIREGVFERLEGEAWKEYTTLTEKDVGLIDLHWGLYHEGKRILREVELNKAYPDFLKRELSKKFVLYGDGSGFGGDIVATWQNNRWTIKRGKTLFYFGGSSDYLYEDSEAIRLFYEKMLEGGNDNVYWKVLESDEDYDKLGDRGSFVPLVSEKISDIEGLYNGIIRAEHGSSLDFMLNRYWIRAKYNDEDRGSSAYGPVQLTMGLAKGYRDKAEMVWTEPERDYLDRFVLQGELFLKWGGDDIPNNREDLKRYDYGGSEDLTSEEDKIMYKQVVLKILERMLVENKGDYNDVLFEWRFGSGYVLKEEDKEDYKKYTERFYSEFDTDVKKVVSESRFEDMENIFRSKKFEFSKELIFSDEEMRVLTESFTGKKIKVRDSAFDVGVDESVSPFVISFSVAGVEKYGLQYYPYGAHKSDLFFGSGKTVTLDMLPFILVRKEGSSWVEVGEESVYKLESKDFPGVFRASVVSEFLKELCQ